MDRYETLKHLDELTEFTDSEIALNAEFIRQLARQAHVHINVLRGDRDKIKRKIKATTNLEYREKKLKEYITRMIEADDILFHEPIRWKDTGTKLLKSLYTKEEQV
jgi:hypothetical protein